MVLENKLGITNQIELNRAEESISKKKAKALFMTGIDISYYYEGYSEFRTEDL